MSITVLTARLFAFGALLMLLFAAPTAYAGYQAPKQQQLVLDQANKLSPEEVSRLQTKLSDYWMCSTNEVAVFIPASLEGNTIEDVAYVTFNAWKLGAKAKDNGVLLVIAPGERKNFIATGKGMGGALTDLQAFEILKTKVTPRLRNNEYFPAVDDGTTAIMQALGGCASTPAKVVPKTDPGAHVFVRIAMSAGLALLAFFFLSAFSIKRLWRAALCLLAPLSFNLATSLRAEGFQLSQALDTLIVMSVCLLFASAFFWLRRLKASADTRPGISGGSDSYDGSSSEGSSSSDYSSGGGGSTGGGGAGDSW